MSPVSRLGSTGRRLAARAAALGSPLAVPAVRRLWSAQVISELGDWAARLALSVLVYNRTGSAALAGAVTAASLVPWLGPGQLLTGVSERWPRRTVMIASDLLRAAAFGLAALPLPVPVLIGVVFCAGLATPPFEAARSAIRPEIVPAPLFGPTIALTSITEDLTVLLGYLAGGGLVALLGAQAALACNAGSFALSALVLLGLPAGSPTRPPGQPGGLRRAADALRGDPLVARAVLLVTAAMLSGSSLLAMSAPFVLGVLREGPVTVGALIALGSLVSVGATALTPVEREPAYLLRWAALCTVVGGGGVLACFGLVGVLSTDATALAAGGFAAGGLLFAVLPSANVVVAPRLRPDIRASAFSVLMGTLVAAEATGAAGAGLAATAFGLVPVCAALGVPALAVGAWALLVPPGAPPGRDARAPVEAGRP